MKVIKLNYQFMLVFFFLVSTCFVFYWFVLSENNSKKIDEPLPTIPPLAEPPLDEKTTENTDAIIFQETKYQKALDRLFHTSHVFREFTFKNAHRHGPFTFDTIINEDNVEEIRGQIDAIVEENKYIKKELYDSYRKRFAAVSTVQEWLNTLERFLNLLEKSDHPVNKDIIQIIDESLGEAKEGQFLINSDGNSSFDRRAFSTMINFTLKPDGWFFKISLNNSQIIYEIRIYSDSSADQWNNHETPLANLFELSKDKTDPVKPQNNNYLLTTYVEGGRTETKEHLIMDQLISSFGFN